MSSTTSGAATVTLDRVSAGDQLPTLAIDVTATTVVLGALASRDWRPMHHDHEFATVRNGTRNIFLNTPNQAAWFERYLTDWTGPRGRLGQITFRMKDSIFPDDQMVFSAEVTDISTDPVGCGWVALSIALSVGDKVCTTATARVAIPIDTNDNPWSRSGDQWQPTPN